MFLYGTFYATFSNTYPELNYRVSIPGRQTFFVFLETSQAKEPIWGSRCNMQAHTSVTGGKTFGLVSCVNEYFHCQVSPSLGQRIWSESGLITQPHWASWNSQLCTFETILKHFTLSSYLGSGTQLCTILYMYSGSRLPWVWNLNDFHSFDQMVTF